MVRLRERGVFDTRHGDEGPQYITSARGGGGASDESGSQGAAVVTVTRSEQQGDLSESEWL